MSQKGFAPVVILLIVAGMLIIGGIWYYKTNQVAPYFNQQQGESSIQVLSPVGGERWITGTIQTIRWTPPQGVSTVTINICPPELAACNFSIEGSAPNTGSFSWKVGDVGLTENAVLTGSYAVVIGYDVPYTSPCGEAGCPVGPPSYSSPSKVFTVIASTSTRPSFGIRILNPYVAANAWQIGKTYKIEWRASGNTASGTVNISFYRQGSNFWIAQNVPVDQGFYNWTLSSNALAGFKDNFQIHIVDSSGGNHYSGFISIVSSTQP